jgi:hypothetical protein
LNLAILQSGLSNSKISFTSLIPHEDFAEIYNDVLSRINTIPELDNFHSLGVFERNNWNNDDITPYLKARWIKNKNDHWDYNPAMKYLPNNIKEAVRNNDISSIMTLTTRNREANSNFVVFSWENDFSKEKKDQMRKEGDSSFIQKGLFQKVYNGKDPLMTTDQKSNSYFVYKAINAWGDSYRANEFYNTEHKSVIDNGFIKVDETVDDKIVKLFNNVEEAKIKKIESAANKMQLRDGYTYSKDMINSKMLEKMGYIPEDIGKILKSIC